MASFSKTNPFFDFACANEPPGMAPLERRPTESRVVGRRSCGAGGWEVHWKRRSTGVTLSVHCSFVSLRIEGPTPQPTFWRFLPMLIALGRGNDVCAMAKSSQLDLTQALAPPYGPA